MIKGKVFIVVLIPFIIFVAWQQSEKGEGIVKINIVTKSHALDSVWVADYSKLTQFNLVKARFDSLGECNLLFNLKQPCFLSLQIGRVYSELFLAPGFELMVSLAEGDVPILKYTGNGAGVNNYLHLQNNLIEHIKTLDGTYIGFLEPEKFIERLDTLKSRIREFHNSFMDTTLLDVDTGLLLKKRNEIKIASICQEYVFLQQNNAVSNGVMDFALGTDIKELIGSSIPFDTTLLALGQNDYRHLLQMHVQNTVYLPMYAQERYKRHEYLLPMASARQIALANYPDEINEYLSATNVQYWISLKGLNPSTDSVFNFFKSKYANSPYLPSLEKTYKKFDLVSNGRPAPNVKGIKTDGDSLSLEELRGKVVYIDVWATWCGPCREEFPYMKELQRNFLDNEELVFLNVSVDRDRDAWDRMVNSDQTPRGIHIINDGSIYDAFLIGSIPRYILIDSHGKIVSADAPRPSSSEIKEQIRKLIR